MQRRTKMKMYKFPMSKLVYTYWMFNVIRQRTGSEKVKRITGVERENDGRHCSMAITFSACLTKEKLGDDKAVAHGRPTLPKIEGKEQNKKGNWRGRGKEG